MGRQHQGMDRPRVRQVPEGSREQGKMEKIGCKIICGVPTTLAVKGLMMMMMMMYESQMELIIGEAECRQQFLMIALTLGNDIRHGWVYSCLL